jgi:hypothetical protein
MRFALAALTLLLLLASAASAAGPRRAQFNLFRPPSIPEEAFGIFDFEVEPEPPPAPEPEPEPQPFEPANAWRPPVYYPAPVMFRGGRPCRGGG